MKTGSNTPTGPARSTGPFPGNEVLTLGGSKGHWVEARTDSFVPAPIRLNDLRACRPILRAVAAFFIHAHPFQAGIPDRSRKRLRCLRPLPGNNGHGHVLHIRQGTKEVQMTEASLYHRVSCRFLQSKTNARIYPAYHTAYDTFDYCSKYIDPGG